MRKLLTVLFIFIQFLSYSQYRLLKVSDGDTFTLLDKDSNVYKIRLAEIDCPEKKQEYGAHATRYTQEYLQNKNIKVIILEKDRYERYIANVYIDKDNMSLNERLVQNGYAWHYKQYSKKKYGNYEKYVQLESNARQLKKGLWKNNNSISPWEWRKNRKSKNT